jgi:Zn-dependent peptidase ImmA (M78 family)
MPADSVRARVTPGAGLRQVIDAKAYWKVATVNLARRAHRLTLLTDWQYRSICIALSKRGRANEPNPLRDPETSQVLAKVLRLLRDENKSKTVLVSDLGIPADELSKSVFGHMFRTVAGDGESSATSGSRPSRSHLRAV